VFSVETLSKAWYQCARLFSLPALESTRMSRIIVLVILGSVLFSPGSRADDALELAKAAVQAAGGADKLPKIVHWKETYFVGPTQTKGTEREANIAFPSTWYQGGQDIALGNADRTEKAYLVWVWTLGPLLDKDSKLTALPPTKLGDKTILGLRLSREKQKDIDLYFHEKTHRLARIDWRAYQIDFDDWKETEGFRYPAKSFVRHKDGTLYLRTEFQLFEVLKELPRVTRK
jgi:hypothetical protein